MDRIVFVLCDCKEVSLMHGHFIISETQQRVTQEGIVSVRAGKLYMGLMFIFGALSYKEMKKLLINLESVDLPSDVVNDDYPAMDEVTAYAYVFNKGEALLRCEECLVALGALGLISPDQMADIFKKVDKSLEKVAALSKEEEEKEAAKAAKIAEDMFHLPAGQRKALIGFFSRGLSSMAIGLIEHKLRELDSADSKKL